MVSIIFRPNETTFGGEHHNIEKEANETKHRFQYTNTIDAII